MDEQVELDRLRECDVFDMNLDFTTVSSKVVILIQAYVGREIIRVSSLSSDTMFIMQVCLNFFGHRLNVTRLFL